MKNKSASSEVARNLADRTLRLLCCGILAAAGVTTALNVEAASQTWTNAPASQIWTNTLNWVGQAVPGAINGTGNSVNNDTATFNSPIPGSGIGGATLPILVDDATVSGDRSRELGSIIFDTANCGAYVFSGTVPDLYPSTGLLYLCHNGSITMNASVTNTETFQLPILIRLPSSTAGVYSFVNNSTNANATLQIYSATNDSANTRGTTFMLNGSNTGTNAIYTLSADATYSTGVSGMTKEGTGTWVLTGPNTFRATAPMIVNNGTLIVKDPAAFGLATTATAVSNGVLQVDGVTLNQSSITLNSGGTLRMNGSATVNGVTVGTALGTSVTLATTSASDVMSIGSNVNQPTGGSADSVIHVSGPGMVQLLQSANYVGSWSLDSGTTQLGSAQSFGTGPAFTINAGATLDVTQITSGGGYYSVYSTTVGAAGTGTGVGSTAATIAADPAGVVDLASGMDSVSLTFTPTSASGDITHPALYISSGTLSLSGNAFSINNASGTPLGAGTYKLIQQASGTITSGGGYSVVGVSGSGLASGTAASIQVNGSEVDLVVVPYTAKSLVWTGGQNSTWNVGVDANWLNGATYSIFNNSDNVTFNSVGSTNPTVTISSTVAPGSVVIDTTGNNYTFSGSGAIAGAANLVKIGTGTAVINNVNTYAGGTVISNGVLQVGTQNAVPGIGAGDVAIYGSGVLDLNSYNESIDALVGNGTVDSVIGGNPILTIGNNDNSGTFSGSIQNTTGSLALTKNGNGTETLSSSNSYAGGTTINAGTLAVANYDALGAGLGTVMLNNGTLDVQTNLLIGTLAGTAGTIANNSTSTRNTLVVTNTSTFGGLIVDGSGGGGLSVLVAGGTLRLNAANTYSGGTIVASGAGLAIGSGASSAGTGGILASNNSTISQPNTGSSSSGIGNNITTVSGALVTLTSASTANAYGCQFYGDATTTNVFSGGNMSVGGGGGVLGFSNFLGTVIITNGEIRWGTGAGPFGGDNTTFDFISGGGCFTRDATIIHLGALFGDGVITGPSVTPSGTYWIGAKGIDSEFSGQISGSNNIVKTGAGRLTFDGSNTTTNTDGSTFTNYLYASGLSYIGSTTVSNGVLALSVPASLASCSVISLAGETAVLDVTKMGYVTNFTDSNFNSDSALVTNGWLEVYSTPSTLLGLPQTLNGFGTVQGNVLVDAGAFLSPGLPTGNLTISGTTEIAGEVIMNLDRDYTPANSELSANTLNLDTGATLVVTNAGPSLVNGSTFKLFSKPVSGFTTVSLPLTDPTGTTNYVWTDNLSVDGTITLTSGGVSPVASNPTNITYSVSGNVLTLSWPADHTGWRLLVQTNNLASGISANTNDWMTVPGSSLINQTNITIDPANPTEFFRLAYP